MQLAATAPASRSDLAVCVQTDRLTARWECQGRRHRTAGAAGAAWDDGRGGDACWTSRAERQRHAHVRAGWLAGRAGRRGGGRFLSGDARATCQPAGIPLRPPRPPAGGRQSSAAKRPCPPFSFSRARNHFHPKRRSRTRSCLSGSLLPGSSTRMPLRSTTDGGDGSVPPRHPSCPCVQMVH